MLKLHGRVETSRNKLNRYKLLYVTKNNNVPEVVRSKYALIVNDKPVGGYGAYLDFEKQELDIDNQFFMKDDFRYLSEGDVIRLDEKGNFAALFRVSSPNNTILLTTRCNHYCLMCSQPPTTQDDSWILSETMELLEMIPKNTQVMGYSGGEPTLYGDGFVNLLQKTKQCLPDTMLDVLTNGRAFANFDYAKKVASVQHPKLTFGIPIYSHDPVRHDFVVQAKGAFDETIRGVVNLKGLGIRVEIRIVIHKLTIDDLIETCKYITRNLLFVDHVALMGLEITGFTRANLDQLWIDPFDYKDTLSRAVKILNDYQIPNSVYNHQLCVINQDVLGNYHHSISDWKNEFVEECNDCSKMNECGGFFSSSKQYKYSSHITPFK